MANKDEVRAIEARVHELLRAEFGGRVTMAGGQYTETDLTLKVRVQLGNEETRTEALREQFNKVARLLGLLTSDFDLPLRSNGNPAKLVRIEPSRKHPFVLQTADGRNWKAGSDNFLAARARAAQSVKAA